MKCILANIVAAILLVSGLVYGQDILVVANKSNPIRSLTKQQLVDLYMGRIHYFQSGGAVLKMDAPRDSELRVLFYKSLVGMSLSEINAYWARLMFCGRATPPMQVSSSRDIAKLVSENPNALGYIREGDENDKIKTVFVIHVGN
jgi:ABC-type phosphate transport system substrate-binding protein